MSRVSVANPFDLLTDENEDRTNVPAPKAKEQKPAAPKATPAQKPAAAAKPAATGAAAAKAPAKPAEQKAAKPAGGEQKPAPKPSQAGGTAHQGNNVRAPGAPRDANQSLVEREKDYRPSKGVDRRDRPKAVPPRDANKRTFDRKSGTGRAQNEVKRHGQGKGNWGGEIDARETPEGLKEEKPVAGEDEKEEEVKEGEEKAPAAEGEGEKKEGEGEKKPEAPPAPEELGLDEYLEKLKKKAPKVEALKPRTVTTDDFAGLVPLKRDEDEKKKVEKKAEKKAEKKPEEKKAASDEFVTDNKLAAELLKFQSHRDSFRGERRGPRRENSDRSDRPPRDNQNRGPRGPRNAHAPAAAAAASPAAAGAEFKKDKDFPALGPHGTSPADQPVAGKA